MYMDFTALVPLHPNTPHTAAVSQWHQMGSSFENPGQISKFQARQKEGKKGWGSWLHCSSPVRRH